MKRLLLLILIAGLTNAHVIAQYQRERVNPSVQPDRSFQPVHSTEITVSCKGIAGIANSTEWSTKLVSFEKRHHLPPAVQAEIDRKTAMKLNDHNRYSSPEPGNPALAPELGVNVAANVFDGYTPPDNHIAVSNNGTVVSVINSNIEYYDTQGNLYYSKSFADFFGNNPNFTGSIYDPVVIYDSQADRFFMAVLHGSESSISKVLVCFTQSSDISDGWWYYELPGNALSNGCWFDYPKVGFSNNEVYVTGNLFKDDNSFSQALIYQIRKAEGYAGGNISYQYWCDISNTPFTLVPASWGQQGAAGPGMYFVTTADLNNGDKIYLFDLTDDMSSSNETINVYSTIADFSLAGDAIQKGTVVKLNNDDTRGLQAFYLNGIIHFTFHSDRNGGYAGINYNRLRVSDMDRWSSIFGKDGYDYSYPSLASFSNNTSDMSVMISFLRSGSDIYPQTRVVYCDDEGNWSGSTLVKDGESYVDVYESNQITRWGDYSGAARKHNASSPEVWVSGCYGVNNGVGTDSHHFNTWIGQVKGLSIGIEEKNPQIAHKVFPNPVKDIFSIDFEMPKDEMVKIFLSGTDGKEIRVLFEDKAAAGKNQFSFNKGALSSGVYFLNISTKTKTLANEKIIVL